MFKNKICTFRYLLEFHIPQFLAFLSTCLSTGNEHMSNETTEWQSLLVTSRRPRNISGVQKLVSVEISVLSEKHLFNQIITWSGIQLRAVALQVMLLDVTRKRLVSLASSSRSCIVLHDQKPQIIDWRWIWLADLHHIAIRRLRLAVGHGVWHLDEISSQGKARARSREHPRLTMEVPMTKIYATSTEHVEASIAWCKSTAAQNVTYIPGVEWTIIQSP